MYFQLRVFSIDAGCVGLRGICICTAQADADSINKKLGLVGMKAGLAGMSQEKNNCQIRTILGRFISNGANDKEKGPGVGESQRGVQKPGISGSRHVASLNLKRPGEG